MYIAFSIIIIYCLAGSLQVIVESRINAQTSLFASGFILAVHSVGLKQGMLIFTHHRKRRIRECFYCPKTELGQLASPPSLAQLCPFTWWQPWSACRFQTQEFGSLPPPCALTTCSLNCSDGEEDSGVWMKQQTQPSTERHLRFQVSPIFKQILILTVL